MSGESNAEWGEFAAYDTELASVWDDCERLPEPGTNEGLDAFCEAKRITHGALLRLGAKLTDHTVLAFGYGGTAIKYRDLVTDKRWTWTGSEFTALKIVAARSPGERSTVLVAEGETDAARLSDAYPEADVAVMGAGAKYFPQAYADQLSSYEQVLVALDNDDAGNDGAALVAELVPHAQRFVAPDGANDWCSASGDLPPLPEPPTPIDAAAAVLGSPLDFDFEADPGPPDYLVDGMIERGTVVLFSGDTGAGKSIIAADLAIAMATERPWLGRAVEGGRVLYLDEENPDRLVRRRLKALGMTNDDADDLLYYNRQGIMVDGDKELAALRSLIERKHVDLLVVDTSTSATAADLNDNRAVAAVVGGLRTLAADLGVTVLVLHHERKRVQDVRYDPSQAAMGARAWANQVDAHSTVTRKDTIAEVEDTKLEEGHKLLRSTVQWRPDVKGRGGEVSTLELVSIQSEKDAAGRTLWMRVESEGPVEDDPGAVGDLSARIVGVLKARGEGMKRIELARALGEAEPSDPGGTFKRALDYALAHEMIVKGDGRGMYELAAADLPAV